MLFLLNAYADITSPGIILLLLILFFGTIALIVFLLRNFIPGIKEKSGKVNEEIAVQEELERVLEPITDEKILAEMSKTDTEKDE